MLISQPIKCVSIRKALQRTGNVSKPNGVATNGI